MRKVPYRAARRNAMRERGAINLWRHLPLVLTAITPKQKAHVRVVP
jgi:hypothetical protein